MATFNTKSLIDEIIAGNGYYYDDPRVVSIVEYTNKAGQIAYGVTYVTEPDRDRYLRPSEFIINPKVIWEAP